VLVEYDALLLNTAVKIVKTFVFSILLLAVASIHECQHIVAVATIHGCHHPYEIVKTCLSQVSTFAQFCYIGWSFLTHLVGLYYAKGVKTMSQKEKGPTAKIPITSHLWGL
jgi:uncharacterized membrane protein